MSINAENERDDMANSAAKRQLYAQFIGITHPSSRKSTHFATETSVLALTEDSQIVETVRVCADEDAGMHLAVS